MSRSEENLHKLGVIRYKNLLFNTQSWELQVEPEDETLSLSLKEGIILKLFMENPRNCLSRDFIQRAVWGKTSISPRSIDSHISKLRRKLRLSEANIEGVYGAGYVFS
ncbi:MAG: winged helix-turn-helix transcriptional regulator [Oligoflexales bacterium]|nr:winged helix-turn-helix transcriptional regulator [Oligoflexales bacterium]